jgi:hypothetical protein
MVTILERTTEKGIKKESINLKKIKPRNSVTYLNN